MTPVIAVNSSEKNTPKHNPSKMPWAMLARQTSSTPSQRRIVTKYRGLTQPLTAFVMAPRQALANTPVTAMANSARGRGWCPAFGVSGVIRPTSPHQGYRLVSNPLGNRLPLVEDGHRAAAVVLELQLRVDAQDVVHGRQQLRGRQQTLSGIVIPLEPPDTTARPDRNTSPKRQRG